MKDFSLSLNKYLIGKNSYRHFFSLIKPLIESLEENHALVVNLPGIFRCFYNHKKKLKQSGQLPFGYKTVFLLTSPQSKVNFSSWKKIADNGTLVLWMDMKFCQHLSYRKFSLFLNDKEKQSALNFVRNLILNNWPTESPDVSNHSPKKLSSVFNEKINAAVTIWHKGKISGCQISLGQETLKKSLEKATSSIFKDSRFKKITPADVSPLSIQISLISAIALPLNQTLCFGNYSGFNHHFAYCLVQNKKKSWYLPSVFNELKFNHWREFFEHLKTQKAGLASELPDNEFFIEAYYTSNFIESTNFAKPISLTGPMPKFDKSNSFYEKNITGAANWLVGMQQPDGSFIYERSLNSLSETIEIDWTRSIFSALSLAHWGSAADSSTYTTKAALFYNSATKKLAQGQISFSAINLAYLGQLAFALNFNSEAIDYAQKIIPLLKNSNLDPLELSQAGTFFCLVSSLNKDFLSLAVSCANQAQTIFDQEKSENKPLILARYAELMHLYLLLFNQTQDKKYLSFVTQLFTLFLDNQLGNGAFQISTTSYLCNSSSTGKIVEALCSLLHQKDLQETEKIKIHNAISKALRWLFSFQYSTDSFMVEPEQREKLSGAIRFSFFNSNARIDSVGHLLMAAARLKQIGLLKAESLLSATFPLSQNDFLLADKHTQNHSPSFPERLISSFLDYEDRLNIVGFNSSTLNWASAIIEKLARGKILVQSDLSQVISYKQFENFPGFYESRLTTHGIRFTNGKPFFSWSRGFSQDINRSVGQVLGEMLERYFHGLFEEKKLLLGSPKELLKRSIPFLSLSELEVFSDKQKQAYPFYCFNDSSRLKWEKCFRATTKEEKYIPAQLIYMNYLSPDDEPRLRESNSSGLAGQLTEQKAILVGLYELIQRDSFFQIWLNNQIPDRIDPETVHYKNFDSLHQQTVQSGLKASYLFFPSPIGLPTFVTILNDGSGNGPCYSLGASCEASAPKAIFRSLEEAWSTYYWSRQHFFGKLRKVKLPQNYKPFLMPISMKERIATWANPAMQGKLNFFISPKLIPFETIAQKYSFDFPNVQAEYSYVIKAVEDLGPGYEVYVHLSDNPWLKKINYVSARVFVPNLIPLYCYEHHAPLFHPRLRNSAQNLNPILHPFP